MAKKKIPMGSPGNGKHLHVRIGDAEDQQLTMLEKRWGLTRAQTLRRLVREESDRLGITQADLDSAIDAAKDPGSS